MKLYSKTLLVGTAALLLLGTAAGMTTTGCGGSDGDDGDGGTTSGGTSGANAGQPPARPEGQATTDTSVRTFAIDSLKLGVNSEWKSLGYNIDKKVSAANAKDTCKAVPGGITPPHQDGNDGIDNSFGALVLPKLIDLQPDIQSLANTALTQGSFTVMVQVTGLPSSAPADLTGLSGQLFAGGRYYEGDAGPSDPDAGPPPVPPKFGDTSTDWPVLGAILNNQSDPSQGSKIKFSNAYVAGGTLVTGDRVNVDLNLSFSGIELTLSVKQVIITMKPGASGTMTDGIISGFLVTSEVAEALKKVGGRLSTSFCGTAVDTFIENLRTSSDMLSDGTTDGSRECDAISIGLGFTAAEIGNPTRVAPAAADTPDPCTAQ